MFGRLSIKTLGVGVVLLVLGGGMLVAFLQPLSGTTGSSMLPGPSTQFLGVLNTTAFPGLAPLQAGRGSGANLNGGLSDFAIMQTGTMTATSPPKAQTQGIPRGGITSYSVLQTSQSQGAGYVQFFSNITMRVQNPAEASGAVMALAYSEGGYVASSTTASGFAYVLIRVPAANFQDAIAKVQALGNVTGTSTTSDDVTVKYTDLNATLSSLLTEQQSLLRLVNESSSVNNTLAIETQLQNVNQQINSAESQILQTRRLIEYSTIGVTIDKTASAQGLSVTLSDAPRSGRAPLSVTFDAVVKGGSGPYYVTYNFGDGNAQAGQVVVHAFYRAGTYNVTASVTDSAGKVATTWTLVNVQSVGGQSQFSAFVGALSTTFVRVLEGIAEVAVIVIPITVVLLAVVLPLRRRAGTRKGVTQQ
jgi:Domain of unknown function (DUF4349)/PKD domain